MPVKKDIILIPAWVQDILRRNQLELSAALDLAQLRPIMSQQDIAGFLAMQDNEPLQILTGLTDAHIGSLYFCWSGKITDAETDLRGFLNNIVSPLSEDASTIKDLKTRLFSESAKRDHHKEPFICYDLSPEFAGVVVYPGFFGSTDDRVQQISLVEAMLKALYVYKPYNEVSTTPLFKRYLELLSAK